MLPDKLRTLVYLLSRLPGVGEKTAQRFAFHLAADRAGIAALLGRELSALSETVVSCTSCGFLADRVGQGPELCSVCRDSRRNERVLCVVAKIQDLLAIEASGAMPGKYFVLGKLLSPLEGISSDDLPLDALRTLLEERGVEELILATPPSVDGEATALMIAQELRRPGLRLTRIASGVPHGGDLEFADRVTLGRAIDGRRGVEQDS